MSTSIIDLSTYKQSAIEQKLKRLRKELGEDLLDFLVHSDDIEDNHTGYTTERDEVTALVLPAPPNVSQFPTRGRLWEYLPDAS